MLLPHPPPLPREHGAWVMLAMPCILGLGAGNLSVPASWLIAAAALAAFLGHRAIVPWLGRLHEHKASPPGYGARRAVWGVLYLAGGAALFVAAWSVSNERGSLLAIAACSAALATVYALASVLGRGRSIPAEIAGMAGTALVAAMIGAAAGRPFAPLLLGPSVLALAYSLSSLAYVRAYERLASARGRAIGVCTIAHAVLLGGVVAAAVEGIVVPYATAALVPVLARTASGLARPPRNLRALGLRELWVAAAYAALAALGSL